ncbi:MAG: DUF302 domain-containing protein [Ignavibacteria bacterium]|nr:DUF302 domain-containing protein [Ignavibacteria bacterium]
MNYKKETVKPFDKVLEKLQEKVTENGFRILHIHNVKQTLKEKGFEIEDYLIVEVCNAKFANNVINVNKEYGIIMPCKINIYSDNGKTVLLTPEPSIMASRFGMKGIENIAGVVDIILKKIIDETI